MSALSWRGKGLRDGGFCLCFRPGQWALLACTERRCAAAPRGASCSVCASLTVAPTFCSQVANLNPSFAIMFVVKRDGRKEQVAFDKITARIKKLCYGFEKAHVDAVLVAQKVVTGVYDGVTTIQLDDLASETAAFLTTQHPDYGRLAARIAVSNLHKQTEKIFSETMCAPPTPLRLQTACHVALLVLGRSCCAVCAASCRLCCVAPSVLRCAACAALCHMCCLCCPREPSRIPHLTSPLAFLCPS